MKKINSFLKLFGFTLVHARRPKAKVVPVLPRRVRTGDDCSHYVGDDCPGGHSDLTDTHERPRVEQPNSKNDIVVHES